MKEFLEKYADSFEMKDALKLVKNKLHQSIEYHNDGDELRSYQCLAEVSSMIDDLFEMKKIDINSYKRV